MIRKAWRFSWVVSAASLLPVAALAQALDDVLCSTPPPVHCGETCAPELLAERGNAIEPETGRAFFLDYPCDLAPGEQVLFILSIHGAGSIGNWQRHYFPAVDFKDEHRLVVATPSAAGSGTITADRTVRMWMPETDDAYLQNIVELVLERFGRESIGAFWLAGHSQGGMTSNRIVCTDFFRDKVDGWLSLSGGRIGRAEIARFLRPRRVYPECDGGRLVADILRLDKGHTEGLEPRVTEALVELMVSAPGGKIAGRN